MRAGTALCAGILASCLHAAPTQAQPHGGASTQPQSEPLAELSLAQAYRLVQVFLQHGQYAPALDLIATLEKNRPNSSAALLILKSQALRGLNDTDAAVAAGRDAFNMATSDAEKFAAARAVAQAYSTAGRRGLAQWWLRRAADVAPDVTHYALARRDFEYVQSRNPWRFSLDVNARGTDNINNAPTDNKFTFLGVTFENPTLFPISGLSIQSDTEITYRLPATETRHSELTLAHLGRRVILGSEASDIDPDLSASDLSSDRLSLSWSQTSRSLEAPRFFDTEVTAFATWQGQKHIQNGLIFEGGYTFRYAPTQNLRVGASLETAERLDREVRSYDAWSTNISWTGIYEDIGRFDLYVSYEDVQSASEAVARDRYFLSGSYELPEPIFGAVLSVNAMYSEVAYDNPLYGPDPRQDRVQAVTVSAALPTFETFGFFPVLDLRTQRVKSNVTRFDTETTNLGLSFRSSF